MPRPMLVPALITALFLAPTSPAHALGDAALVYLAPSPLTVSYEGLAYRLQMAGASRVDVVGTWSAGADLAAAYRLIVVTAYDGPLEPALGDDLAAFVAVGGGVVVMAEHDFGDVAGNAIAERLGLEARFDLGDTGGGCSGTDASAPTHELTRDAPTVEFAWARTVTGGTLLYGTAAPIVTVDGTVVLAGDSDIFSDPVAFGGCPVGPSTEQFYANLFTSLPDEGGGPAADAGPIAMPDAGVVPGGALGASCTRNEDCSSSLCVNDGSRMYCTQICTDTCPGGLACTPAGGVSVCTLPPASTGGCQASAGRAVAPLALGAYALVLFLAARRRAR